MGWTRRQAQAVALAFGLGTALAAATVSAQAVEETPHITVSGQGEVQVVPDMATVSLGVEVQEADAATANRLASERMREVLRVLTRAGVADADVQTSGLALSPVYDRRTDVNRAPRLVGFEASNIVRVTVRDLTQLGPILDSVIRDGANSFRGVSFDVADAQAAEDEARRAAVADAVAKASVFAEAAGVSLGTILTLTEGGMSMPQPEFAMRAMADSGVPVAPGSLTIGASVTVTFALVQ